MVCHQLTKTPAALELVEYGERDQSGLEAREQLGADLRQLLGAAAACELQLGEVVTRLCPPVGQRSVVVGEGREQVGIGLQPGLDGGLGADLGTEGEIAWPAFIGEGAEERALAV